MWFVPLLSAMLAAACASIAALLALSYLQPRWVMRGLALLFPSVLWSFDTREKVAALTIDDAPSEHIDEILDVLREHGVRATFFVIGSYAGSEAGARAVARMLAEGHEIGNHSWSNFPSAVLAALTPALFELDLTTTHNLLADQLAPHVDRSLAAGRDPGRTALRWFRPSHGFFTPHMLAEIRSLGYRCALGDVYPHDPQLPFSRLNTWHVKRGIHPGAIVILHDRWHTAATLRMLLPELVVRRGYVLDTLTRIEAFVAAGRVAPRAAASGTS